MPGTSVIALFGPGAWAQMEPLMPARSSKKGTRRYPGLIASPVAEPKNGVD
jgi:hypothetical protein